MPHHLDSDAPPTVPIYTPAELTALAQSPLVKQLGAATHTYLHEGGEAFAEIALSRRQQRTREYMARKEEAEASRAHAATRTPAPARTPIHTSIPITTRRRPVGRVAERSPAQRRNAFGAANKFVDAASWRPATVVRHSTVEVL